MSVKFQRLKNDPIRDVLDSIEALSEMEPKPIEHAKTAKDVLSVVGEVTGKSYQNIHDKVIRRYWKPSADLYVQLEAWNEAMLHGLSSLQRVNYRRALARVKKERA